MEILPFQPSPSMARSKAVAPKLAERRRTHRFGRATAWQADHFKLLPWPNTRGIRLLNGMMQVGVLPAVPLPDSVKVARRPVKPLVLVRVQVWQPFE